MTPSKSGQAWHSLAAAACFESLGGCTDGLTTIAVERRRADVGPNRLELAAGRGNWQILWDQFSNVMLKFPEDAIAIVLIVGLNGLLALRDMAQPMVFALIVMTLMVWSYRYEGASGPLICVGVSLVFFVYLEAEKLLKHWRRRASANVPTSLG
ncbi:MAG: cation-transporting P-type ATPase [Cyanobium sp.]